MAEDDIFFSRFRVTRRLKDSHASIAGSCLWNMSLVQKKLCQERIKDDESLVQQPETAPHLHFKIEVYQLGVEVLSCWYVRVHLGPKLPGRV